MMRKKYSLILTLVMVSVLVLAFAATAMAADTRTTTLDCSAFSTNQSNDDEGWSWKQSSKTLTLTDADFEVENGSAIILPAGATLVFDEDENYSDIYAANAAAIKALGDLTIEGGMPDYEDYAGYVKGVDDYVLEVAGDLTLTDTYFVVGGDDDNTGVLVGGNFEMNDGAWIDVYDCDVAVQVEDGDALLTDDAWLYIDECTNGLVVENGNITVEDEGWISAYVNQIGIFAKNGKITFDDGGAYVHCYSVITQNVDVMPNSSAAIAAMSDDSNKKDLISLKGDLHAYDYMFGSLDLVTITKNGKKLTTFEDPQSTLTFTGTNWTGAANSVEIAYSDDEEEHDRDGGLLGILIDNNNKLPFTDVVKDGAEYQAIKYVYENNLMQGVSATSFDLKSKVNRAMTVTVLHRLAGTPAASGSTFKDIKVGSWYEAPAYWGAANKIVAGVSASKFSGLELVTREQLASFFYRYAEYKGLDINRRASLNGYYDYASVADYAKNAMSWAVSVGLFQMDRVGYLQPQANVSRGELAMALRVFDEAF